MTRNPIATGALLCALTLPALAQAPAPAPAAPAAPKADAPAATAPAFKASTGLHWYRTSAEHRAAYLQAYRLATLRVDEAAQGRKPGTWAVILDVDDTILDVSGYQKEYEQLGHSPEGGFSAWSRRKEAVAVPGARAFLEHVRALGGKVVLVTNRGQADCPATEENVRAQQLPFDQALCRTEKGDDKNPRFEAVQHGVAPSTLGPLDVVLWVGDNIQDFPGLKQAALRDAPDSALDQVGVRFIVLPNPTYGSWMQNPQR